MVPRTKTTANNMLIFFTMMLLYLIAGSRVGVEPVISTENTQVADPKNASNSPNSTIA
jgi:hypothetical protein